MTSSRYATFPVDGRGGIRPRTPPPSCRSADLNHGSALTGVYFSSPLPWSSSLATRYGGRRFLPVGAQRSSQSKTHALVGKYPHWETPHLCVLMGKAHSAVLFQRAHLPNCCWRGLVRAAGLEPGCLPVALRPIRAKGVRSRIRSRAPRGRGAPRRTP